MSDAVNIPSVEIPVSKGIPLSVKIAFVFGIALIILIISLCVSTAMAGHVWPSENSTKVPLTSTDAVQNVLAPKPRELHQRP